MVVGDHSISGSEQESDENQRSFDHGPFLAPRCAVGVFAWILAIGIQFGLFVHHFTSGGTTPFYPRPPGVEGFLPIGALASTKHWLMTGEINPLHPAAMVLFVSFVVMSLLAKKSFCSWLCPVGTLSELLWKLGRVLFGENFHLWRWLDVLLRGLKYALLFFFTKLLLFDMPQQGLAGFFSLAVLGDERCQDAALFHRTLL